MKTFLTIISLAALGGCAVAPPGPPNYGSRLPEPSDPSQWHVVSVTPVPAGTGQRLAASAGAGSSVQYSSEPIVTSQPVYVPQPVYIPQPVYVPQPIYQPDPYYYYPPISIGLGFNFGRGWGGHHEGGRHGWGGVGFGSHWHR
jgi:hypothetical protein